ncbi:hypothetical protein GJ496_010681 [Pomphorhynchus laevis]|nr:hypothetical protein GJ496_010681 [Pomphorhynchus laevis]
MQQFESYITQVLRLQNLDEIVHNPCDSQNQQNVTYENDNECSVYNDNCIITNRSLSYFLYLQENKHMCDFCRYCTDNSIQFRDHIVREHYRNGLYDNGSNPYSFIEKNSSNIHCNVSNTKDDSFYDDTTSKNTMDSKQNVIKHIVICSKEDFKINARINEHPYHLHCHHHQHSQNSRLPKYDGEQDNWFKCDTCIYNTNRRKLSIQRNLSDQYLNNTSNPNGLTYTSSKNGPISLPSISNTATSITDGNYYLKMPLQDVNKHSFNHEQAKESNNSSITYNNAFKIMSMQNDDIDSNPESYESSDSLSTYRKQYANRHAHNGADCSSKPLSKKSLGKSFFTHRRKYTSSISINNASNNNSNHTSKINDDISITDRNECVNKASQKKIGGISTENNAGDHKLNFKSEKPINSHITSRIRDANSVSLHIKSKFQFRKDAVNAVISGRACKNHRNGIIQSKHMNIKFENFSDNNMSKYNGNRIIRNPLHSIPFKRFTCRICRVHYSACYSKAKLHWAMKHVRYPSKFACGKCKQTFTNINIVLRHWQANHEQKSRNGLNSRVVLYFDCHGPRLKILS